MRQTRLTFPSGELSLVGAAHIPDGEGPFPAVVVCHPHPLFGGSMDNNVVAAVSYALCRSSILALRFNLRGVEGSGGRLSEGIGDPEDVVAALSFVASMDEADPSRIGLFGYSAGAVLALSVAHQDERVQAVAAVSPPPFGDEESPYTRPRLLIWGSRDMFTAPTTHSPNPAEPTEYEVIEGADHFWGEYEEEAARRVAEFFSRTLNP